MPVSDPDFIDTQTYINIFKGIEKLYSDTSANEDNSFRNHIR